MQGSISLNLADGAIRGINVVTYLRDAKDILKMGGATTQTQSADNAEKMTSVSSMCRINS